jgi:DNA-binding SARP family transcriptional activator
MREKSRVLRWWVPMTTCRITLLGGFQVSVDGRAAASWPHRRAAELVKLLALADRHKLHREQVMDALWPDLGPEAAAANLRKALHFARKALSSDQSISIVGEMVELYPDAEISVDTEVFEDAARSALKSGDVTACRAAADSWSGDFLPEDRYATWADEPRERLQLLHLEVLKRAGLWERVLVIDPADEDAHRALMQKALDAGDRGGVIRQFERLRERLRVDMGMGPDPKSVALYEKALAIEGGEPISAAEQVRVLLSYGLNHLNSGELETAERTAEEARSLAIDADLGREIGEASALLGIIASMRNRWEQVFRAEFVASVRRSPEIASYVFDAHLCLAEFCLYSATPYEHAVGYMRELLQIAEDAGSIQGQGLAELLWGEADLFSDRLETSEQHLKVAAQLHREAEAPSGEALATQRLAEVALARGRRSDADRMLQKGLRLAQESRLTPHLIVRMHGGLVESATDPAAAVERIMVADRALDGTNVCPPCSMSFRVAASIALARAGQLDRARRRLEETERLAGMWPGGAWHASVWEARGVLRRAEGREDQASALLKEAAELFEQSGRPRDASRCRVEAEI